MGADDNLNGNEPTLIIRSHPLSAGTARLSVAGEIDMATTDELAKALRPLSTDQAEIGEFEVL